MEAEFDRLDRDKNGELDRKELLRQHYRSEIQMSESSVFLDRSSTGRSPRTLLLQSVCSRPRFNPSNGGTHLLGSQSLWFSLKSPGTFLPLPLAPA